MRRSYWLVVFIIFVLAIASAFANVSKSRSLEFTYDVIVKDIPPGAQEVKIWMPSLSENPHQIIDEMSLEPKNSVRLTYDKQYNNKIIYYSFKLPKNPTIEIKAHYKVKRNEYSNRPMPIAFAKARIGDDPQKYLSANRLVTISPQIQSLAAKITKGKKTTMVKARAIYDYVLRNVSYDKIIPGWGNGDTERVCLLKAGNCTDFHSLFISLARSSGIPSKFVMGVSLASGKKEGEISGYHCWAEFYDEQLGWVPVDISEAWKNKSKYEYYFGTIEADRLEISVGRDIVLEPNANTEPLNYFFYPYVEVDGKKFLQIKTSFRFKDVNTRKEVGKL